MKKLLLSAFTVIAISLSVAAQDTASAKRQDNKSLKSAYKAGRQDKRDKIKALNLSKDQRKEMKENREEYKTKIAVVENDQSLTEAQRNEKKDALKKEQKSNTQALLTPDQKARMSAARKTDRQEKNENSEKRTEELKTKLSLTNEQVMQMKALNVRNHKKMKDIRNDNSLDEAAKNKKMEEIKVSSEERRRAILTADQLKKMDDMKKGHKLKAARRAAK